MREVVVDCFEAKKEGREMMGKCTQKFLRIGRRKREP